MIWMMLYWIHPLKILCTDKYAVRSYVTENGLGHMLPELIGVYTNTREINFAELPERYVLKGTHGCGFNVFCLDKSLFDIEGTRRKLDRWMKIDFGKYWGELHYSSIRPRILCEAYLEDLPGRFLVDYKIYCFDGKAHCTMVCTGRGSGQTKFDFYDLEWRNIPQYCRPDATANQDLPRPENYEIMIEAAERLSKPFPFVRVDFFSIRGKVVFGEMTFTPSGGIDTDLTEMAQNTMGELIQLPVKRSASRSKRTAR